MIHHLDSLDKLANDKANEGCRAELKKLADRFVACGNHDKMIETYRLADHLGHLNSSLVLTIVSINQGLLFFQKSPDDVKDLISKLTPTPKGRVGDLILTRMAAVRIKRIHDLVATNNNHNKQMYEWQVSQGKGNIGSPPVYEPLPELRTIQEIRNYVDESKHPLFRWDWRKLKDRLEKELLNKPELTDENISLGMDLVIAGQVMSA